MSTWFLDIVIITGAEIHDLWHHPHLLKPPQSEPRSLSSLLAEQPCSDMCGASGILMPCAGFGHLVPCIRLINLDPSSANAILLFLCHTGCDDVISCPQIIPKETRDLPQYSWLPQNYLAASIPYPNPEE